MSIYNMLLAGGSPPIYQDKRSSLVMIGASVVWGDGLDTTETYAYKMQAAINSKLSNNLGNWPARFFHVDDIELGAPVPASGPITYPTLPGSSPPIYTVPFNGYEQVSGFGSGINNPSAYLFNPLVEPYSSTSYGRSKLNFNPYDNTGRPSTVDEGVFSGYAGTRTNTENFAYKNPLIRLNGSGQNIRFALQVNATGGFLYAIMKSSTGSGSVNIFGATGFAPYTHGTGGNIWTLQLPTGNPSSASQIGSGGLNQPVNNTSPQLYIFPLDAIAGTPQGMSINWAGGSVDIISMWVSNGTPATNHIGVQACARNSYCLQDYFTLGSPTQPLLDDIMRGVLYNTSSTGGAPVTSPARAALNTKPYYVLGDTYNSMVTSRTAVNITGATGTGSTATLTFAGPYTFPIGSTITVSGVTNSGYNGTYIVAGSTSTSVSYANATSAASSGGSISAKLSPSVYTQYIEGMGDYLASSAICPGIPVVVMPIRINTIQFFIDPAYTWDNYRDALRTLASNKGWRFVDQSVLDTIDPATGYSRGYVPYVFINSATGNGSTATLTFSGTYAFPLGSTIVVSNINVAGYNGTYTVTGSSAGASTSTVSYANSTITSGAGGTVSASGARQSGSYSTQFYQPDGLHPTPTGATAIANLYISALGL